MVLLMNCEHTYLIELLLRYFHYIGKSIWFIFDNLYILISGIEVLSQYIASCGFSGVILVLSSNFIGVDAF